MAFPHLPAQFKTASWKYLWLCSHQWHWVSTQKHPHFILMWLLARRHKGSEGFPPVLLLNAQNVSWGKQHQSHLYFFFLFFFPFWKQKRAAVATSEWKNTGLELCNEKTSSSEGGRGTTKHLSLIYRLSSVGSLWTHLWSSVPLNTEEKYRMWFSCLLVRCFSKSAFGLANEGPS